MPEPIQHVWRNISQNKNSTGGFVVTEILEVIGSIDNVRDKSVYTECHDGSYIFVMSFFFWTVEKAVDAYYGKSFGDQRIIFVEPYPKTD